jgi:hypothetical protein
MRGTGTRTGGGCSSPMTARDALQHCRAAPNNACFRGRRRPDRAAAPRNCSIAFHASRFAYRLLLPARAKCAR